jgi:hypothetical protein
MALGLAGCNQVFGLEPPAERAAIDAPPVTTDASSSDGAADDASSSDASSIDASLIDARLIDARVIDAPTDACPLIDDGNECTFDTCGNPPLPRDTLCNGGADQCDGAGHCVECTNSGGCGECCVCLNQTCVPA